MDMEYFASPTSQQHMRAGFMLVTMEDIVWVSFFRFLHVDTAVLCLELFQSMFTRIMLTQAVLCSSDTVTEHVEAVLCSSGTVTEPCSVAAAEHVDAAHAEHIALAVAVATA